MIASRFQYCITCWSQAPSTIWKSLKSLYKRAVKILDKKDWNYHHCHVYNNLGLLNLENQIKHANLVLIHRILNESASPTLRKYVQLIASTAVRDTRASTKLDCKIPFKSSAFGQAAWSARGIIEWNKLPNHLRAIKSTKQFSLQLKQFVMGNQICQCL